MSGPLRKLVNRFCEYDNLPCISDAGKTYNYSQLYSAIDAWVSDSRLTNLNKGQVVLLQSDFTFTTVALFFALLNKGVHVCLVSPNADIQRIPATIAASASFVVRDQAIHYSQLEGAHPGPLYDSLIAEGDVGFVILTSGTTGEPKAVLHSVKRFTTKYNSPGKRYITLAFLLLDHIAGVDNLFYTLSAGGHLVCTESRQPRKVSELIQKYAIQVLPTSPSFLNLWLLSGELSNSHSSLEIVTYGSERMPQPTLDAIRQKLPATRLIQKYGSSEFGSPSSKSRGDDSLWVKLSSDSFKTKVVDGVLWVKASTTMIGYLNADSPGVVNGWLNTGDRVEQDGDWIKFLGRESQIINVGGEKVFPSEVEEVILQHPIVVDAAVSGMPHPILGEAVSAIIQTAQSPHDKKLFKKELRSFLLKHLARYKVPVKYSITQASLVNERQKKIR